ncbi:MAG: type VI secretion system baseplate subunit TssK [Nitrospinota bacterium]|nr:MAG: type VI secretion system baseplate subunit TssK [Nitrospinota bacterium]
MRRNRMNALRPIFWGQGMFLQPQHFQQQDRYHETRLWHALHLSFPFCWGIKSLVINEAALQNFLLEIEQCELITREGTLVCCHGEATLSNARIVPRNFEEALDAEGKPLEVYLGLKRLQWEEGNVTTPASERRAGSQEQYRRFSIQEITTPDLFTPDTQGCPVQYLVHEVRILFAEEIAQAQDYELIKIAELLRATEGQGAVLSRRYIPPAISVYSSPVLTGMLKEMRDLLTAKGRELAEYKRQRRVHTVEMGARETVYLLMMQMVNRYIPLFHHYLEIEETPPALFYALLRQLIGEFSTFSETISVLGGPLPPYRHDHLWECFDVAIRTAKDLLNELTKGPEYTVPLAFDGEYFTASLDQRFFEGNNRYYLSIKVDLPPKELLRRLTETGKVCSREEMEALRQRALPGLQLDYLDTPPEELPRRAHCSYFLLDHHAPLWRRIEQRQNIAVYCELPSQETEMELLVISET